MVKINLDTDAQYAFTRAIADHMFTNYDGVLRVDGNVGRKSAYDPRAWGRAAEAALAQRISRGERAVRRRRAQLAARRPSGSRV